MAQLSDDAVMRSINPQRNDDWGNCVISNRASIPTESFFFYIDMSESDECDRYALPSVPVPHHDN